MFYHTMLVFLYDVGRISDIQGCGCELWDALNI